VFVTITFSFLFNKSLSMVTVGEARSRESLPRNLGKSLEIAVTGHFIGQMPFLSSFKALKHNVQTCV